MLDFKFYTITKNRTLINYKCILLIFIAISIAGGGLEGLDLRAPKIYVNVHENQATLLFTSSAFFANVASNDGGLHLKGSVLFAFYV